MPATATYRNALPIGTQLLEYRLEAVLGAGGFGMTYRCTDTHLDKPVAIKEYFPADLALRAQDGSVVTVNSAADEDYRWGLERFIQEARTLAKFSHAHIVRVNRYFEANDTGYMVMDYEEGESLYQLLLREPLPGEARMRQIVLPLLDGLQAVHETGFLHRDIKPSNIFIRSNGSPLLLDFGAARQAMSGTTNSLTAVLTPGYAPLEQYSGQGHQGPWSDIYAMAGVIYRAYTSENPPDAVSRLRADSVPARLARLHGRVSEPALRALEWALALDETQRPASVEIWRQTLEGKRQAPVRAQTAPGANAATLVVSAAAAQPAAEPVTQPLRQPPSQPLPEPLTQPVTQPLSRRPETTRPRAAPPASTAAWRWAGIAALLILLVFGGRTWHNQRETQRLAQQEAARVQSERLAQAAQAPDTRGMEERAAQLHEKERQLAEREEAIKRSAEREAALRRLDEERQQPATSGATQPPPAAAPTTAADAARAPTVATSPAPVAPPAEPPRLENFSGDALDQKLRRDFRHMDTNGDGLLSADEVRGQGPIEQDLQRLDSNGDGRLSLQEFMGLRRLKPPLKLPPKW